MDYNEFIKSKIQTIENTGIKLAEQLIQKQ